MKKSLFTLIAILFAGVSFAQTDAVSMAAGAVSEGAKPGAVLSELSSAIDPKLYLKAFDRDKWKKNLDNIANPMAFGRSLTDLAFGLSPEAFTPEFANQKNAWLSKAKGITKYADASALLKEFEAGLNPKFMSPDWTAKKATWLKSLDALK